MKGEFSNAVATTLVALVFGGAVLTVISGVADSANNSNNLQVGDSTVEQIADDASAVCTPDSGSAREESQVSFESGQEIQFSDSGAVLLIEGADTLSREETDCESIGGGPIKNPGKYLIESDGESKAVLSEMTEDDN